MVSQPQFVPASPTKGRDYYQSPPRRDRSWTAARPGDVIAEGQPAGAGLGSQGPDQGYAIKLAKRVATQAHLRGHENVDDVVSGCVVVALKRASLFGRAPTMHDVRSAFALFGYLETVPGDDLAEARHALFAEVANPHHYEERRAIADAVPAELLRKPHTEILGDAAVLRSAISFPSAH